VEESEDEDEDGRMLLGARSGLGGGAIPMFGAAARCLCQLDLRLTIPGAARVVDLRAAPQ
jgi:hypothetical protein